MAITIELVIGLVMLGMFYALMSEGLWGATLMFFNILFAGLIAFNFYEPLAQLIVDNVSDVADYADVVCLMVLLLVSLVILRTLTGSLAKRQVRFPPVIFHLGRLVFAFLGAALATGIVLTAMATAPVQKKLFGTIGTLDRPPFKLGLNHRWLALVRFSTARTFARYGLDEDPPTKVIVNGQDYFASFGGARVFDLYGLWWFSHEMARPYGESSLPNTPKPAEMDRALDAIQALITPKPRTK